MKVKVSCFLFSLLIFVALQAQERTVGLLSYVPEQTSAGLNLIYPHGQNKVFLLNNCGEVVHSWTGDPDFVPGNSVYLQDDGSLIKCSRHFDRFRDSIFAGGAGALVESLDWDSNVLWSFEQNDSTTRLHHDVEVLPNGNVLMISWEQKSREDAIQAGRNPDKLTQGKLWPDYILEFDPILDSVVWEWHVWDHLIQEHDSSMKNFGIVSEHSERVDLNYETNSGHPDWLHTNSIDYNEDLDQIILSVPNFDEFWIIDHSTSTLEARGSVGGLAGKGGDLLYRWGNPQTYQGEGAKKLFFQHDVQWIRDFIPSDDTLRDRILLFNNRFDEDYSVVNIVAPSMIEDGYNYVLEEPIDYLRTITHPEKSKLFSTGLSSAQYLPNGNFLILSGRRGYAFELTPDEEIVWEYKIPLANGQAIPQGSVLENNANLTFRFNRYPLDFGAFQGKDITGKGVIQLNEDPDGLCNSVVSTDNTFKKGMLLYPNPASDYIVITSNSPFTIYSNLGQKVYEEQNGGGEFKIDLQDLAPGIYYVKTAKLQTSKFIKF